MTLDLGYILELEGRQRGWMRFRRQKSLAYLQRNTTWKNLSFVIQKSRSVATDLSLALRHSHPNALMLFLSNIYTHARTLSFTFSFPHIYKFDHTHALTHTRTFFLSPRLYLTQPFDLKFDLSLSNVSYSLTLGRAFDLDSYWNFLYPFRCNSLFLE